MSIDLKPRMPDQGLRRLRNRYSVVLAATRRHLSPPEFSRLLRMQGQGDLWLLSNPHVSAQRRKLAHRLNRALEGILKELDEGEFPRSGFMEACRRYGQVFGD